MLIFNMIIELEILIIGLSVFLFYEYKRRSRPKLFPPGPVGIPIFGYLLSLYPDSHVRIGKLGEKYGNIFSIKLGSFWFVVLNDYDTIKAALKNDSFTGRPNYLLPMQTMKKGIVFSDGPSWQEQRRFSLQALRDFGFGKVTLEASIREEVANLMEHLKSKVNQPIEIKPLFAISVLNALWHIVASEKFALDDPMPKRFYQMTKEGFMDPKYNGPVYFLPSLAKWFPEWSGLNKITAATDAMKVMILKIIKEHQETFVSGSRARDCIDVYLQEMEKKKNDQSSSFYGQEGIDNLVDCLMNLFVAGADTLSCSFAFAFLYLVTRKDVAVKVQDEIDRVVGTKRAPDASDRSKMPYTEAVLQECYRLSAIATGGILHTTTEDVSFQGVFLPKGTIIMPNLYQVHHDEKYWVNPEEFYPERFINPDGSYRKDEHVIPFSIGKRVCIAENMAQAQFFLFVTGILQNFDISEHKDHPLPDYSAQSASVLSPQPYKLVLSLRKN